jgi:hypothetical protein
VRAACILLAVIVSTFARDGWGPAASFWGAINVREGEGSVLHGAFETAARSKLKAAKAEEEYRKKYGDKTLLQAFLQNNPDCEYIYWVTAMAAWKAGIPVDWWASICAAALLSDYVSVGAEIGIFQTSHPETKHLWIRYEKIMNAAIFPDIENAG